MPVCCTMNNNIESLSYSRTSLTISSTPTWEERMGIILEVEESASIVYREKIITYM
jgi:hypothetical protein